MNLMRLSLLSLVAAISLETTALTGLSVQAKQWTVEQRQATLMQDINSGQNSGALTAQQSKKLRKSLANVARTKAKMKAKQNGTLSADDTAKLQSRIDTARDKIRSEKGQELEPKSSVDSRK